LNTINGLLEYDKRLLEEKLTFVKELDQKIIEICEVVDIASEIDEAEELVSRVLETTQDPPVDVLKTFWGTESIGIKGDPEPKEIIESFNGSVHFNGTRYMMLSYHGNKIALQYRVITSCVKNVSDLYIARCCISQSYYRINVYNVRSD
jgi:hypothetical protein